MATDPQRKNLEPLWTAALDRRGAESVNAQLEHTGHGQGAEFRNVLPGYNRNPSREFVETWLARRKRRRHRVAWAFQIGVLAIAALGVAVAL